MAPRWGRGAELALKRHSVVAVRSSGGWKASRRGLRISDGYTIGKAIDGRTTRNAVGFSYALSDNTSSFTAACSDVDSSAVEAAPGGQVDYDVDMLFEDPLFCEPVSCFSAPTADGDYSLEESSVCLVGPCGQLIGAIEELCGASTAPDPARDSDPSDLITSFGPNPSAGRVEFLLQLPEEGIARVDVFDVAGRPIRTIPDRRYPAGASIVEWDLREFDRTVDGVYFLRVKYGNRTAVRRFVLF